MLSFADTNSDISLPASSRSKNGAKKFDGRLCALNVPWFQSLRLRFHVETNWMTIYYQSMKKKNRISAILVKFSVPVSSIWKGISSLFMRRRSHSSAQLVINASPNHICWIDILKQCMRGNSLSVLFVLNGSLVKTNSRSTWMRNTKVPLRIKELSDFGKNNNKD